MTYRRSKPIKNKNGKNIETRLFTRWQSAMRPIDRFASGQLDGVLKVLKWDLGARINSACGIESRLTAYDEQIFESYERLIGSYRTVVNMNLSGNDVAVIREIWEGVHSVLLSRLMIAGEKLDGSINPILAEKKEIVANGLRVASRRCDGLYQRFKLEHQRDCISCMRKAMTDEADYARGFAVLEGFVTLATERLAESLHEIYVTESQNTHAALNNLSARPQAQYYYDLLLAEQQILAPIIKIQLQEIERRLGSAYPNEHEPIQKALLILKEAYQHVNGEIAEIWGFFARAEEQMKENLGQPIFEPENRDDFVQSFEELEFFSENLPAEFEEMRSDFAPKYAQFLDGVAEAVREQITEEHSRREKERIYYMRKFCSEQEILVKEAAACFGDILRHYRNNTDVLKNSEFADIAAGIGETIEIKIDGMSECLATFMEETNEIITKLAKNTAITLPQEFDNN